MTSVLSAFPFLGEQSFATPGAFNSPLSILSANIAAVNAAVGGFSGVTISPPSGNTITITSDLSVTGQVQTGALHADGPIRVDVHSGLTNYLYFGDTSHLRSDYIIGSQVGGTADGLNIWDASGATMIAGFSKQSIRFYQKIIGPVFDTGGVNANVVAYGAIGDGVANDTAAIADASAAAGINGAVFFPAGTYLVSIITASIASQQWTLADGAIVKLQASSNRNIMNVTARNVTVQGGMFDGNRANNASGHGLAVDNVAFFTVRDTIVANTANNGLNLVGAADAIIQGCQLVNLGGDGIFGEKDTVRALIQANTIDTTAAGDADGVALHSTTAGKTVSGCRVLGNNIRFAGAGSFGIEVGAFGGDTPIQVVVADNVISSISSSLGGISFANVQHSVVKGNAFDVGSGNSATVAGIEFSNVQNAVIAANVVKGGQPQNGVVLDMSSFNAVIGNILDSVATAGNGIKIGSSSATSCNYNTVSGNIIKLGAGAGTGIGIFVQSNHASTDASDNVLFGNQIIGANTPGSSGIVIQRASGTIRVTQLIGNVISHVSTAINSGVTIFVNGSIMTDVTTTYAGSGPFFRFDPQNLVMDFSALTLHNSGALYHANGSPVRPTIAFASELSLGFHRSGNSTMVTYGSVQVGGTLTALRPGLAFSSESSVGFYLSGVSTIAQSYGTFNLATNGVRLSMRTIAASAVTASAANTNVAVDEAVFTIQASGASFVINSGGTTWIFNSSASAKNT